MKTHQPTQQVSVAEYLEDDAVDDRSETPSVAGETRTKYLRADVDPTTKIFLSDRRYHRDRGGVPGCPEGNKLPRVTIEEAARQGIPPCQKCTPVDYRTDRDEPESTALEDFQDTIQQGDSR